MKKNACSRISNIMQAQVDVFPLSLFSQSFILFCLKLVVSKSIEQRML